MAKINTLTPGDRLTSGRSSTFQPRHTRTGPSDVRTWVGHAADDGGVRPPRVFTTVD